MLKIKNIISNILIKMFLKLNPSFIVTKDTDEVASIINILRADREYIIFNLAKLKKKPFSDGTYFFDEFNNLVPLTDKYIKELILLNGLNSFLKKYTHE